MKLALIGYGRMGREIERIALESGHDVIVRLDVDDNPGGEGITSDAFAPVDAAIDFSEPGAAFDNIDRTTAVGTPLVVGTTGWHDRIDEARGVVEARQAALVYGANLSVGANLFFRIVADAAALFDVFADHADHDPYVLEHHHRAKVDAPSGTALHLGRLITSAHRHKTSIVAGNPDGRIDDSALHVASLRAGTAFGEHTVGFDGAADVIRLTHSARGREGFARGALLAAEWIADKTGFYEFSEVLDAILAEHRHRTQSPEEDEP